MGNIICSGCCVKPNYTLDNNNPGIFTENITEKELQQIYLAKKWQQFETADDQFSANRLMGGTYQSQFKALPNSERNTVYKKQDKARILENFDDFQEPLILESKSPIRVQGYEVANKKGSQSTKNRLTLVFMKQLEQEEQQYSSDSDQSFQIQKNSNQLKESVMDRKIQLWKKRIRLGQLKRDKERLDQANLHMDGSFTGKSKALLGKNILTDLIQELEQEKLKSNYSYDGGQSTVKEMNNVTKKNNQHQDEDGDNEKDDILGKRFSHTPQIKKEDDSFYKSMFELGDLNMDTPGLIQDDMRLQTFEDQHSMLIINEHSQIRERGFTMDETEKITKRDEEFYSQYDAVLCEEGDYNQYKETDLEFLLNAMKSFKDSMVQNKEESKNKPTPERPILDRKYFDRETTEKIKPKEIFVSPKDQDKAKIRRHNIRTQSTMIAPQQMTMKKESEEILVEKWDKVQSTKHKNQTSVQKSQFPIQQILVK